MERRNEGTFQFAEEHDMKPNHHQFFGIPTRSKPKYDAAWEVKFSSGLIILILTGLSNLPP
jgi:hypothetical protein